MRKDFELRAILLSLLLFFLGTGPVYSQAHHPIDWATKPAYQTHLTDIDSTAFSITDSNVQHVFYNESHAILILEGAYSGGGWSDVSGPAARHEKLLRESLEAKGFEVLVWRNLKGAELRTTLGEVFAKLGYRQNTRLFFYYYGHGYVVGSDADTVRPKSFLVPVDAPDPSKDEQGFYDVAIQFSQIMEYANEINVKHAFYVLEGCQAGSIFGSLGGFAAPNPLGYLLGDNIQRHVEHFLTAGSVGEDVLADGPFTPLLVEAMDLGDLNQDGYVTGSEVLQYVVTHLPLNTKYQNPEKGDIPTNGHGDMVFGRVGGPGAKLPKPSIASPAVSTKEEVVFREWRSPELSVDCERTNSGRVSASIPLQSNEKVLSVSAQYENTTNIKDISQPVIEGAPSPSVVVSYGFNGLDRQFLNCPGGGHAVLVVRFQVQRTVVTISPPTGLRVVPN